MKILIADDDPHGMKSLQNMLEDWGYEPVLASGGVEALAIMQQRDAPPIAILDRLTNGLDAIEVCRLVRSTITDRYVYLIVLGADSGIPTIVEAMDAGADDFIARPFHRDELQVRVRAGKRIGEVERELRAQASRDALTGAYNRSVILEIVQKEVARHKRTVLPVAAIFGNIDRFRHINDQYGHLAGDEVLREVSLRISMLLRPYDSLGRYSGEELLAVLPDCGIDRAADIAERIREQVAATPVMTETGPVSVTISLGVAVTAGDAKRSPAEYAVLIRRAELALREARLNGRNCVGLAH